jgi:signal peptidase I
LRAGAASPSIASPLPSLLESHPPVSNAEFPDDDLTPGDVPSVAAAAASITPTKSAQRIDWGHEARSIFWLILCVLGFHSLIAKPFYIPSESMMPLLLKGDRLVVSKYPYGWSYASLSFHPLPFLSGRVWGAVPERGDVVIVYSRRWKEDYIKRVIGLPGDVIEVRRGHLFLNGEAVAQQPLPALRVPVDANADCPADQFPGSKVYEANGRISCRLNVLRETLPNGRSYMIVDTGENAAADWYGPQRVPAGHLFLMGDNRDNSADSRFSLEDKGLGGPVPIENIGGRAEFLTFSMDGTTSWSPFSWFFSFRSGRAGTSLRAQRAPVAEQEHDGDIGEDHEVSE